MSDQSIQPGSGSQPYVPVENSEEVKSDKNNNQPEYKKMTTGGPGAGGMTLKERMAQKKIQQVTTQNNIASQTETSSDTPRSLDEDK
ncbi:hypothetical protein [Endozoicomonas numazuensis]|uniref:Uncharacterized protein n=1 Tax=Endozoicomonas numazuensis TaxID=1137799 RepID=A0A081NLP1_9GAMM|nr:hypothetical protein [Endozoicomonas numazuensis]KEQ19364.1 hypothetical protein GZ78_05215 [Endozoicomonas numazuensis]